MYVYLLPSIVLFILLKSYTGMFLATSSWLSSFSWDKFKRNTVKTIGLFVWSSKTSTVLLPICFCLYSVKMIYACKGR